MATKVDGIPTTGVLPAVPTGIATADLDTSQKYADAIQKILAAVERPRDVSLAKISAALADPGRTGHWSEGFGRAMGVLGQHQEAEQARELPIAQMRAALAGQQVELGNKQRAFGILANTMGFPDAATAAKALQTSSGIFGLGSKFTPELYAALSMADQKVADIVKNAAGMDVERFKAMTEATKTNMSIAQMYDQFGKDVTDRFMRLQGNMPLGQGAPTGRPTAATTRPQTMNTPAGEVPLGADGIPTTAIRDSNGNVVDIGLTEEPSTRTVNINGVEVTRPAQGTPNAPATGLPQFGTQDLGGGKFKLQPSGRIVNIDPKLPPKEQRDRLYAEIKVDQELFKKREETDIESEASARSKRGEPFQKKFDTVAGFDYNTVQSNEIKNRELIQLMKDHPDVVGQLVHQGPIYALLQVAESGITTPFGSLSVPVSEAINKLNLSPEKQAVARNAMQIMSELNQTIMRAGKDIYGPQISAFDAQEMAKPGFKATDPMSFIVYLASKNIVTNKYLGEMAEAQQDYFDKNPKASTSSFFSAKNKSYTDIVDRYGATMRDLVANSPYRKK
jgi:hypothetical protein